MRPLHCLSSRGFSLSETQERNWMCEVSMGSMSDRAEELAQHRRETKIQKRQHRLHFYILWNAGWDLHDALRAVWST